MDVEFDLQTILGKFKNWHGNSSPLSQVSQLSINPYNGHQASASQIYVNDIRLSPVPRFSTRHDRLEEPATSTPNIPFAMTFDDDAVLSRQMAYRGFESSTQAFQKGIGGNTMRAIRLMGHPDRKHIAFLPMFDKLTGRPLDLTKVKRIFFRYFLTNESDDFPSSKLFLASENWSQILLDDDVHREFTKGKWTTLSLNVDDLDLHQVHGDSPIDRSAIYELRFDLSYLPGHKEIEMWIDDFGWE